MRKEDLSGKYVLLDKGAVLLVFNFKTHKLETITRKNALNDFDIKNYILDEKTGKVIWSSTVQFVGETGIPVDLHFLCLDHCGRQKYVMYCYSFNERRIRALKYPEAYLDNKFAVFVGKQDLKDIQEVLDSRCTIYASYKDIEAILCDQEISGPMSLEKEELIGDYLSEIAPRRVKVIDVMENGVVLSVALSFVSDCKTRADVVEKLNKELAAGDDWPDDVKKTDFVDELLTLTMC